MIKFTIPINPRTKKNSQRIIYKKGKPCIIPSKDYEQYKKDCFYFMPKFDKPIDYKVNVKAVYYKGTRHRCDLTNLHEALHDILVDYGVLKDDNYNIISSTDGSKVYYDKENPRTEIEITEVSE